MSFSTNVSFSSEISSLSLANYFTQHEVRDELPISFSLNEAQLSVNTNDALRSIQQELVVFSNLSLASLLELQRKTHIKIDTLVAINTRNNQTSFRFNVGCDDFMKSRHALADYALAQDIEAALIKDAPKLSTPGLLVMDMDSTTIEIECIDEIAALAGVGEQVSAVTELAMQGELDFAQSLHQRVATLKDAPESILADVAKNIPLMAGLENLIGELKQHNWRIAVASGGFTYFADHLKDLLALDATFANVLEIIDGKLTGRVIGGVVDAQVKADSLDLLAKQYEILPTQTVAMGDGANDLVMMAAASFGVAFHAKPIVLAQADSSINKQGLDCLLHWLG